VRLLAAFTASILLIAGCNFTGEEKKAAPVKKDPQRAAGCDPIELVTEATGMGGPPPPGIDWNDPWHLADAGQTVETFAEAEASLPFPGLYPKTLRPCEIVTAGFLGMRFQDPTFGVFKIDETPLQASAAKVERRNSALPKSCPKQPGCAPKFTAIRLADGRDAVLVLSRPGGPQLSNHAVWFVDHEANTEIVVMGPPNTFSGEDAIAVANDLLAG
jgi:hypothetical protein